MSMRSNTGATAMFTFTVVLTSLLRLNDGFLIQHQARKATSLTAHMDFSLLSLSSPVISSVLALKELSPLTIEDPSVASELMVDAAHVSDLPEFYDANLFDATAGSLTFQTLSVVSRILYMASDFIPDHNILPLEFAYQSAMLLVALAGLFNTITSMADTASNKLAIRDKRCFISLFRPAGVSWIQYKKLMKEGAIRWLEFSPGCVITSSNAFEGKYDSCQTLFWLQKGDVDIQSKNKLHLERITSTSTVGRLIGNIQLSLHKSYVDTTVSAGNEGCIVLSIDVLKLQELMAHDASLNVGIRNIMINGMQNQITTLLLDTESLMPDQRKQQHSYFC